LMRCLSSSFFFFFGNETIWFAHHSKKWNDWGFILKYRVHPFCPNRMGERRKTFAKPCVRKVRCYCGVFVVRNLANLCFDPHLPPPPLKTKKRKKKKSLHVE
jgi:hypothetical protein